MKNNFQLSNSFKERDLGIYLIALSIVLFAIMKGGNTVGLVGVRSNGKTLSDSQIIKIQKELDSGKTSNYWSLVADLIKHSRFNEAEKALHNRYKKLNSSHSLSDIERARFYLKLGEIELRQSKLKKCTINFEYAFNISKEKRLSSEKICALRYLFETTRQAYKFSESSQEKDLYIKSFNKYLTALDEMEEEELSDPRQRISLTNSVKLCLIEFGRFLEVEECVIDSQ